MDVVAFYQIHYRKVGLGLPRIKPKAIPYHASHYLYHKAGRVINMVRRGPGRRQKKVNEAGTQGLLVVCGWVRLMDL